MSSLHGKLKLQAAYFTGFALGGIFGVAYSSLTIFTFEFRFILVALFGAFLGTMGAFTVVPDRIARIALSRMHKSEKPLKLPAIPDQRDKTKPKGK
jgi:hypothetical protein